MSAKFSHDVGQRLRAWRQARSLNQVTAASLLETDVSVFRKYELGKNAPGAKFLAKLSELGVNLNWLLLGEGDMLFTPPDPLVERLISEPGYRRLFLHLSRIYALDTRRYGALVETLTRYAAIEFALTTASSLGQESDYGDIIKGHIG